MHIAQINIAHAKAALEAPLMAGFTNNLDRINALADQSPGFIWRMIEEERTEPGVFPDELALVNMSVWKDIDSLFNFVYKTVHVDIYKGRKQWFNQSQEMHMAFWYVEEGHIPSEQEAKDRLGFLRKHGETPHAFTFRNRFTEADFLATQKS